MRCLKGYRLTRALWATRFSAWVAAGVLGLIVMAQLVGMARTLAADRTAVRPSAPAVTGDGGSETDEVQEVDTFAVIWERLDPEPPKREPPAPAVKEPPPKPAPPSDPYPAMRLLGTITGEGGSYALLEIRKGATKLMREGETFGDVHLLEVQESSVTVEVPHYTKELHVEPPKGVTTAR